MSVLPLPPSGTWEASYDGMWSGFPLQLGSNFDQVIVDISNVQSVIYAVGEGGCSSVPASNCSDTRGSLFNPVGSNTYLNTASGTRDDGRFYTSIDSDLVNAPNGIIGQFGTDTVTTGYQGSAGASLGKQSLATYNDTTYWRGYFGLNPVLLNLTGAAPTNSFIQNLKDNGVIPSKSWGFNAGAYYRAGHLTGSLVLGGYDAARRIANGISFPMDLSSPGRYMPISVTGIAIGGSLRDTTNALSQPLTMHLDSTLPYMWFPSDVCNTLADAWGLTYNSSANLYYIAQTADTGFKSNRATMNFTIASPSNTNGQNATIQFPYDAFSLTAYTPFPGTDNGSVLYFPLKQAASPDLYVLGRAFFQEAYITADFERSNFSVSQSTFRQGQTAYQTISSPSGSSSGGGGGGSSSNPTSSTTSKGSNAGAIAGGVVGGILGAALIGAIIWWFFFRKRKSSKDRDAESPNDLPPSYDHVHHGPVNNSVEMESNPVKAHEMHANSSTQAGNSFYEPPKSALVGSRNNAESRSNAVDRTSASGPTELDASHTPELAASNSTRRRPANMSELPSESIDGVMKGENEGSSADAEASGASAMRPSDVMARHASGDTSISIASDGSNNLVSPISTTTGHGDRDGRTHTLMSAISDLGLDDNRKTFNRS